jgi:hypothetical protein
MANALIPASTGLNAAGKWKEDEDIKLKAVRTHGGKGLA